MARKPVDVFGLAFLDVMFCGFGSVILLVMIISSHSMSQRKQVDTSLRAEVERLQQQVNEGRKQQVQLKNSLAETEQALVTAQGLAPSILATISQKTEELAELEQTTLARSEHINRLQADLKSLDAGSKRLQAGADSAEGSHLRAYAGAGDRQYLTGLKVGGQRILILVDASASMLDETLVNIIRRRNLPPAQRRRAEKWRRAVATVDWLSAHIPVSSRFQIYAFNESVWPLLEGTQGQWLTASGGDRLNRAIERARGLAPEKGTNLYHAFASIKALQPPPDTVYLLTDGLPTQGRSGVTGTKVSGQQRLDYFIEAVQTLPPGVPVNIILFPLEGDPYAASTFWKLAVQTRGALISAARDWP